MAVTQSFGATPTVNVTPTKSVFSSVSQSELVTPSVWKYYRQDQTIIILIVRVKSSLFSQKHKCHLRSLVLKSCENFCRTKTVSKSRRERLHPELYSQSRSCLANFNSLDVFRYSEQSIFTGHNFEDQSFPWGLHCSHITPIIWGSLLGQFQDSG